MIVVLYEYPIKAVISPACYILYIQQRLKV